LGLKAVLRRVYVPEGENPIANVNWQFKWLWLYAFVHPQTGETYWWILPYVNTELFNRVLEDFACEFQVGAKKRVLLAIDQAGWHISCIVKSSRRIKFNAVTLPFAGITTSRKIMEFG
jgi:hypothetical protein